MAPRRIRMSYILQLLFARCFPSFYLQVTFIFPYNFFNFLNTFFIMTLQCFGLLVMMQYKCFSRRQWHLLMSSKLLHLHRVMHLGSFTTSICTETSAKDAALPLPAYTAFSAVILFGVTRLTDGPWLSPTAAAWRFGKAEEHVEIREAGVGMQGGVRRERLCNKMCKA